jgi:hypothetical protein
MKTANVPLLAFFIFTLIKKLAHAFYSLLLCCCCDEWRNDGKMDGAPRGDIFRAFLNDILAFCTTSRSGLHQSGL